MTKWGLVGALISGATLGCGGSGGTGASTPFAGVYSMSYSRASGTVSIIVYQDGTGIVRVTDGTSNYEGTCTVAANGALTGTATETGTGERVTISGNFRGSGNGVTAAVSVTGTPVAGGSPWSANGTATFLANSIGALYQGTYTGSFTGVTLEGSVGGTVTVVVDANGRMSGSANDGTFTYTGAGDLQGFGSATANLAGTGGGAGLTFRFTGNFSGLGAAVKSVNGTYTVTSGATGNGTWSASTGNF